MKRVEAPEGAIFIGTFLAFVVIYRRNNIAAIFFRNITTQTVEDGIFGLRTGREIRHRLPQPDNANAPLRRYVCKRFFPFLFLYLLFSRMLPRGTGFYVAALNLKLSLFMM